MVVKFIAELENSSCGCTCFSRVVSLTGESELRKAWNNFMKDVPLACWKGDVELLHGSTEDEIMLDNFEFLPSNEEKLSP